MPDAGIISSLPPLSKADKTCIFTMVIENGCVYPKVIPRCRLHMLCITCQFNFPVVPYIWQEVSPLIIYVITSGFKPSLLFLGAPSWVEVMCITELLLRHCPNTRNSYSESHSAGLVAWLSTLWFVVWSGRSQACQKWVESASVSGNRSFSDT